MIGFNEVSRLRFICAFCFFISLHMYVKVSLMGVVIPPLMPGIFAVLMLLLNRVNPNKNLIVLYAGMIVVAISSMVFSPGLEQYAGELVKGVAYYVYSITIAVIVFHELSSWTGKSLSSLFLTLISVFIVGLMLENYTILRGVSELFRQEIIIYDLYDADQRDMDMVGMIRPKFFSSEPSFVALSVLLYMTAWFIVTDVKYRVLVYSILSVVFFLLIRSPVLLLLFVNMLIVALFIHGDEKRIRQSKKYSLVLFVGVVACSLLFYFFHDRLNSIVSLDDPSFLIRVVVPILISKYVFTEYPFFGIGIGGYDILEYQIKSVFESLNIVLTFDSKIIASKLVNVFWVHWISLGLVGGFAVIYLWLHFLKKINLFRFRYLFSLIVIVVGFSQVMGGYNGVRFWCFLMTVMSVTWVRRNMEAKYMLRLIY